MAFRSNKAAIRKAIDVCNAVAAGDFEKRIIDIRETGEMGELMHAINLMIDRTDAYLRESKACLDYVSRNQYFRLISEKGMVGSFGDAARSINTATLSIKTKQDGFRHMAETFETQMGDIVENVSTAVVTLQSASDSVTKASNTANEQSLIVASGAEEASANMQNVASATEELTGSIGEINRQVRQSAEIATGAVAQSRDMSQDIESLSGASQKIGEVVNLINAIAAQTNLLALNATIEAARAGEMGRGFAIVAQEVKSLAGQTATATEDIAAQVEGLQRATTKAVEANAQISTTIEQVSDISAAIASAVEQQSAATSEIAQNVEVAAKGTRNVSSGIMSVQMATSETSEVSARVLDSASALSRQERSLQTLREEMNSFLAEIGKVG
ncbi:HAMP domain-containing methyl-accepting chemotaxis protein [Breoghania sp. L-A4]|uniref:methyl-accepting chemotaxis protein n=1 Tax=Breoghania sp. L-A4 TaxID=2304600 RepID=UPI000E35DA62|nr:HAMP domain-containing methyl-accepting chemotaxis protein [Breoghania sp. L-A4]AXS40005.1 methyl-accepting chemotaxis protein [Breoghania sp. L-A4]